VIHVSQGQALFEQAPLGVAWIDSVSGQFLMVNSRFANMLGRPQESMVGVSWLALSDPAEPLAAAAGLAQLNHGLSPAIDLKLRFARADNTSLWTRARITCATSENGAPLLLLMIEDLSRQRELEASVLASGTAKTLADDVRVKYREVMENLVRLRTHDLVTALDAAQSANRAKDAFLATVSHELRTPLNAIIGFSSLLLEDEVECQPGERLKQLAIIKMSGEQLLALVVEILDLASIEAGHTHVELATVDLRALLQEQCELLQAPAAARNLKLRDVECSASIGVVADAGRLRQVMRNLLTNAIKFSDHGHVGVRAHCDGQVARVEVEDTGIGIPFERRAELFKPFQRIVQHGEQLRQGTGLGLAISKRLIEAMGGTIGMTSEPGQGSTFWFALPLAR
jgi:PAS domain S-box-containing protein